MSLSSTIIRNVRAAALLLVIAVVAAAQIPARNGSISGRLSLRNGKPAAGRRIMAMLPGESPTTQGTMLMSQTETDSLGRFLLEDMPPGRYTIATGSLEEMTFYPSTASESQATVFTVTRGGKPIEVDFKLSTVRVSGRIVGDVESITPRGGGRGAAGGRGGGVGVGAAVVAVGFPVPMLRLGSDPVAPKAIVDPDGGFQFGAVPPGTYRPTLAVQSAELRSGLVVVGDDDVTGVQMRVSRRMSFPVTVTVEGAGPAPPVRLRFEEAQAIDSAAPVVVESVTTDSFQVELADLQYRLVLPELPAGFSLKSATLVYPSGGTTSILQQPFLVHQVARLQIVLERVGRP